MVDKKKEGGASSSKRPKLALDQSEQQSPPQLVYDPVHFIRSHSKNNDPADIQTQIWEVVFEPDPNDPSKTTSRVATCGGNSICLIDVSSGTVLLKYSHKELKENFYTLAWTTFDLDGEKTNVFVSGGIRGEIRMFHPQNKVCFYDWRPVDKKGIAVNSLVFHSERPNWLFCGTSDGYVSLWDISKPSLPFYDGVYTKLLLRLFPDYGDVYNIAWTGSNRWLLAGTAAGLVGWHIDDSKVTELDKEYKPRIVDFLMPESERDKGENPIVDSLSIASQWTIVSKCALHGLIYVWDLKSTLAKLEDQQTKATTSSSASTSAAEADERVAEVDVCMLASLKWSDTDNFYMNLGCHKGNGLICCGDDKGSLWLYNLPQFGRDGSAKVEAVVEPSVKLLWPELQDDHLENSRKVPIDRHNIIVDKVATSSDSNYVVAVTSNNMVCIWRRIIADEADD